MIDPLSDENKSSATASFNVLHLREGERIVCLPIPDNVFQLIGKVGAYWGTFEVEMDKLIAAILAAIPRAEQGWDRWSFTKRKQLLVALAKDPLESVRDHFEV